MNTFDEVEVQRQAAESAVAAIKVLLARAEQENSDSVTACQAELDQAYARIAELEAQAPAGPGPDPEPDPGPEAAAPPTYTTLTRGADLQGALDKQVAVRLTEDWLRTDSLKIPPPGAKIYIEKGARLVRNFGGGGATRNALIVNQDWTRPINGLDIRGPGKIEANRGMAGNMFGLWADNIFFRDFSCDYFLGGRYFMGGGANQNVARLKVKCDPSAASGAGGWRVSHGSGVIKRCDIISGDDVYQAVPAGATNDPLFNKGNVDGLVYSDCTGRSLSGRLMVAGLQAGKDADGNTSSGMKSSARNVTFTRVRGFGGGSAVNIAQHNSMGGLDHFKFIDCIVDQRLAGDAVDDPAHGQPGEVYALAIAGLGPVDWLDFGDLTILGQRRMKDLYYPKGPVGKNVIPPKAGPGRLDETTYAYIAG